MIKIDMEIPRNCDGCPCLDRGWRLCRANKKGNAAITNKNIDGIKPEWCPLLECEDEKSCNNCKNMYRKNSVKMCDKYECNQYSEWERK